MTKRSALALIEGASAGVKAGAATLRRSCGGNGGHPERHSPARYGRVLPVCPAFVHPEGRGTRKACHSGSQRQPVVLDFRLPTESRRVRSFTSISARAGARKRKRDHDHGGYIGLITGIAPRVARAGFVRARDIPRAASCEQNLIKIQGASTQWAVECA